MLVAFSIANSGRFAIHLEMYFGVVLLRGVLRNLWRASAPGH